MKTFNIPEKALEWLTHGERGVSSQVIFSQLTGLNITRDHGPYPDHPADPDDLGRCIRLLDFVPEFKPRFGEMSARSAVWARLVESWDELTALLEMEVPGWKDGRHGATPATYKRMKDLGC